MLEDTKNTKPKKTISLIFSVQVTEVLNMPFAKLLLGALSLYTINSWALVTKYVSFDHPEGWLCEFSKGVNVCQSTTVPDREESVVLAIATLATEWDTIENFEDYLKIPRTIEGDDSKKITSEVRYVRKRNINGFTWVDSLQYNSDLPGFWSRYVATVLNTPKAKLAILVTYIVSDDRYKQLAPQFERMVASLKPNTEFDLNEATRQGEAPLPTADKLGPLQSNIIAEKLKKKPANTDKKPASTNDDQNNLIIIAAILVIGVTGYIVLRRRKKSSKSKNRRKAA